MALAHFNVKGYSSLPVRVPTLGEQTEIVRILDSLFAKEQRAKEVAEAVLEKIDLLKNPSSPTPSVTNLEPTTSPNPPPWNC